MNKQRQRPARKSHDLTVCKLLLRTLFFALLLAILVLTLASCKKEAAKSAGHTKKITSVPILLRGQILADARDDIDIIESAQDDWQVLKPAVAGKALDTLKKQIEEQKAERLVKIRDYSDLKLTFGVYQKKVAGVTAEFVDNSRIENIDNGQPMAIARAERKKLYLGLAKVDGKWKIITMLSGVKEAE